MHPLRASYAVLDNDGPAFLKAAKELNKNHVEHITYVDGQSPSSHIPPPPLFATLVEGDAGVADSRHRLPASRSPHLTPLVRNALPHPYSEVAQSVQEGEGASGRGPLHPGQASKVQQKQVRDQKQGAHRNPSAIGPF